MPQFAQAQVIFSEIMYDASGGDADHEWIEIQNVGGSSVDISGYKLREGTTNHGLTIFHGTTTLPAGEFAIISQTPEVFLKDYPNFSHTIFDSVFSLSNTGETISLKDAKLIEVDSISYTKALGASGDGQTLQKINSAWTTGNPTPGAQNVYATAPVVAKNAMVSKKTSATVRVKKMSSSQVSQALEMNPSNSGATSTVLDLSTLDEKNPKTDAWKWYLGLGALVVVAVGGIFAIRAQKPASKPEYEIVE